MPKPRAVLLRDVLEQMQVDEIHDLFTELQTRTQPFLAMLNKNPGDRAALRLLECMRSDTEALRKLLG